MPELNQKEFDALIESLPKDECLVISADENGKPLVVVVGKKAIRDYKKPFRLVKKYALIKERRISL